MQYLGAALEGNESVMLEGETALSLHLQRRLSVVYVDY